MALETVEIHVVTDDLVPLDLEDVVVRVYDSTGTTLETSGTTDADGLVEFTLDGDVDPGVRYQLRFGISGGSIVSPKLIDVWSPAADSPTGTNNFEVEAHVFSLPEAINPRLCRVSGYVRSPSGRPRKGLDIHVIQTYNPLVVDNQLILGERVAVRTDDQGYVEFDLWRTGHFDVLAEGMEESTRAVVVPDRASIGLSDLLFPYPKTVSFDPAGPWTMGVGDTLELIPVITASNYQVLVGPANEDVEYTSSDTTVMTVGVTEEHVVLKALAAGSANLEVRRKDSTIIYVPDPSISGQPLAVTIT